MNPTDFDLPAEWDTEPTAEEVAAPEPVTSSATAPVVAPVPAQAAKATGEDDDLPKDFASAIKLFTALQNEQSLDTLPRHRQRQHQILLARVGRRAHELQQGTTAPLFDATAHAEARNATVAANVAVARQFVAASQTK